MQFLCMASVALTLAIQIGATGFPDSKLRAKRAPVIQDALLPQDTPTPINQSQPSTSIPSTLANQPELASLSTGLAANQSTTGILPTALVITTNTSIPSVATANTSTPSVSGNLANQTTTAVTTLSNSLTPPATAAANQNQLSNTAVILPVQAAVNQPAAPIIAQVPVTAVTAKTQPTTESCNWRRFGCFKDSNYSRILHGISFERADMGPGVCQAYCALNHYIFAAVEFGYQCFCGNCTPELFTSYDGNCTIPCRGQNSAGYTCGGANFLELYGCYIPGVFGADPYAGKDRCPTPPPYTAPPTTATPAVTIAFVNASSLPQAADLLLKIANAGSPFFNSSFPVNQSSAISIPIGQIGSVQNQFRNQFSAVQKNDIQLLQQKPVSGFVVPSDGSNVRPIIITTTTTLSPNACRWVRQGCFLDRDEERIVDDASLEDPFGLTPESCFSFCEGLGQTFAGLKGGRYCYCSQCLKPPVGFSEEKGCVLTCPRGVAKCGGQGYVEIYGCAKNGTVPKPQDNLCIIELPVQSSEQEEHVESEAILPPADEASEPQQQQQPVLEGEVTEPVSEQFLESSPAEASSEAMKLEPDSQPAEPEQESGSDQEKPVSDVAEAAQAALDRQIARMIDHPITVRDLNCHWIRHGCYEDYQSRILIAASATAGSISHKKCFKFCQASGYRYAGLEYGTHCYCGNCIARPLTLSPDEKCSTHCRLDGEGVATCGGRWYLEMFVCSESGIFPEPAANLCNVKDYPLVVEGNVPAKESDTPSELEQENPAEPVSDNPSEPVVTEQLKTVAVASAALPKKPAAPVKPSQPKPVNPIIATATDNSIRRSVSKPQLTRRQPAKPVIEEIPGPPVKNGQPAKQVQKPTKPVLGSTSPPPVVRRIVKIIRVINGGRNRSSTAAGVVAPESSVVVAVRGALPPHVKNPSPVSALASAKPSLAVKKFVVEERAQVPSRGLDDGAETLFDFPLNVSQTGSRKQSPTVQPESTDAAEPLKLEEEAVENSPVESTATDSKTGLAETANTTTAAAAVLLEQSSAVAVRQSNSSSTASSPEAVVADLNFLPGPIKQVKLKLSIGDGEGNSTTARPAKPDETLIEPRRNRLEPIKAASNNTSSSLHLKTSSQATDNLLVAIRQQFWNLQGEASSKSHVTPRNQNRTAEVNPEYDFEIDNVQFQPERRQIARNTSERRFGNVFRTGNHKNKTGSNKFRHIPWVAPKAPFEDEELQAPAEIGSVKSAFGDNDIPLSALAGNNESTPAVIFSNVTSPSNQSAATNLNDTVASWSRTPLSDVTSQPETSTTPQSPSTRPRHPFETEKGNLDDKALNLLDQLQHKQPSSNVTAGFSNILAIEGVSDQLKPFGGVTPSSAPPPAPLPLSGGANQGGNTALEVSKQIIEAPAPVSLSDASVAIVHAAPGVPEQNPVNAYIDEDEDEATVQNAAASSVSTNRIVSVVLPTPLVVIQQQQGSGLQQPLAIASNVPQSGPTFPQFPAPVAPTGLTLPVSVSVPVPGSVPIPFPNLVVQQSLGTPLAPLAVPAVPAVPLPATAAAGQSDSKELPLSTSLQSRDQLLSTLLAKHGNIG